LSIARSKPYAQRLDAAAQRLGMSRSAFIATQIDRPAALFTSPTRRRPRIVR